jgi:hypothetical protein
VAAVSRVWELSAVAELSSELRWEEDGGCGATDGCGAGGAALLPVSAAALLSTSAPKLSVACD